MYEHPYFAEKIAEFENERLERAAEHRRFLAEHADQIVPRAPGAVRRLGQRMLRAITRQRSDAVASAASDAVATAPDAVTTAAPRVTRVSVPAAPAPTAPAERPAPIGCEPAAAR